ncbi:hypothetical protein PPTG_21721 [Phytophthora nicotianae INRA-310]|uniref:Uncharacterized protein n=1 Tax=Phytophthora nicotianae (strain INRA-310) TaxID=761204 RepID=W2QXN8_PHYN3|nr:hypothetical protein PPTG_21721 [Phytophthora nicotianae INRA-310]ETN17992.1 hypothetical protein PPTG_21721 [Phytophthora nicotianae INRA-310]
MKELEVDTFMAKYDETINAATANAGTCGWLPTEWLSLFQGLNGNEHANSHGLTKLDMAFVVHDAVHQERFGADCVSWGRTCDVLSEHRLVPLKRKVAKTYYHVDRQESVGFSTYFICPGIIAGL